MMDILCWLKTFGPGLSPILIIASTIIAILALIIQRDLARKRATLDIFLKTETDATALELWDNFVIGLSTFEAEPDKTNFKVSSPKEYHNIRSYINIFELIACGITEKILDEKMCKNYFSQTFIEQFSQLEEFIKILHEEEHSTHAYCEFVKIAKKWKLEMDKTALLNKGHAFADRD